MPCRTIGNTFADHSTITAGRRGNTRQNLSAYIDNHGFGYKIHYWRTTAGNEVDFILYGDKGLLALEVKRSRSVSARDASSLKAFKEDYPSANTVLLYGGAEHLQMGSVKVLPIAYTITHMDELL